MISLEFRRHSRDTQDRRVADSTAQACEQEAPLSTSDPIAFRPRLAFSSQPAVLTGAASPVAPASTNSASQTRFDRHELNTILNLYGRKVAAGEWRDYAIDFLKDRAVFSVFRRASEVPIYRIEKDPRLARKQGIYSVISASGLILRRGHELDRVLLVIDRKLAVV